MHRGKGLKFVGDSRVLHPSSRKKKGPKDYSEYPGKTEAFWPDFLLKEWIDWFCILSRLSNFNGIASSTAGASSRSD